MGRRLVKIALGLIALLLTYEVVTFVQVWQASRRDGAGPADAIVVFGAAQYDGKPSPVLRARLDHAADLYGRDLAGFVVVTGGRRPGDRFTEAAASANYLRAQGIPDEALLLIVSGSNSWDSLAAAAKELHGRDLTRVLLVSDPFHSARIAGMADELGLEARTSPTRSSPIGGFEELKHLGRETFAVSLARFVGYRRLMSVDRAVTRTGEGNS